MYLFFLLQNILNLNNFNVNSIRKIELVFVVQYYFLNELKYIHVNVLKSIFKLRVFFILK